MLRLEVRQDRSDGIQQRLEDEGLDLMEYDSRWGKYRIRLAKGDLKKHEEFLRDFLHQAYEQFGAD